MNEKVKMIVNTLPLILVPLITERKKFKEHPDVKNVTNTTIKASKKVKTVSVDAKDKFVETTEPVVHYVSEKKRKHEYNKQMKAPFKEEEKEQKEQQKKVNKLDKTLQKSIDKRHKEEQKLRDEEKEARIKEMKYYQKQQEKQLKEIKKEEKEQSKSQHDKKKQNKKQLKEEKKQKHEQKKQDKKEDKKQKKQDKKEDKKQKKEPSSLNNYQTSQSTSSQQKTLASHNKTNNIQALNNEYIRTYDNVSNQKESLFEKHRAEMASHINQFPYKEHEKKHLANDKKSSKK